jgi:hypothetical protein
LLDEKHIEDAGPHAPALIFTTCREAIDISGCVVALLDGSQVDDGTAWEIGYACARGLPVYGLRTDSRRAGETPHNRVNSMIQGCLAGFARSVEELVAMLGMIGMTMAEEELPEKPYITIYPAGAQEDHAKGVKLERESPAAFRTAQDLLEAAEKLIKHKGWFTHDKEKREHSEHVTLAYTRFIHALSIERIFPEEAHAHGMKPAAILYLDKMSAAFPHWKDEYDFLNKFIWSDAPNL